jgi:hypothetical protein
MPLSYSQDEWERHGEDCYLTGRILALDEIANAPAMDRPELLRVRLAEARAVKAQLESAERARQAEMVCENCGCNPHAPNCVKIMSDAWANG